MDDETRSAPEGGSDETQTPATTGAGGQPSLGGLLDDLFTRALASVENQEERDTAQRGIDALRRAIAAGAMAPRPSGQPPLRGVFGASTTMGNSFGAATGALKTVQDLGFVEFTTSLVTGTFDAIVTATIKQIEAYTKLVADLAKTLSQFQAENVSHADVTAHLATKYPDGAGGTGVRADYTYASPDAFAAVVSALIQETKGLGDNALDVESYPSGGDHVAFDGDQVTEVRESIALLLADNQMEYLRGMAQDGMARLVVKNGKIMSKLTFRVAATMAQSTQSSNYHVDAASAHINGNAGWGWGRVSAGASWSQVNVSTMNQSSYDAATMSAEMIGAVEINFETQTFPALTPA